MGMLFVMLIQRNLELDIFTQDLSLLVDLSNVNNKCPVKNDRSKTWADTEGKTIV